MHLATLGTLVDEKQFKMPGGANEVERIGTLFALRLAELRMLKVFYLFQ